MSKRGSHSENANTAEKARTRNEANHWGTINPLKAEDALGAPCFEAIQTGSGQRLGKEGNCNITIIIDLADLRILGVRIGV